ncbi:MAG: prenyltransferase/squalene oxidase repeat-containing protein [Pirellulaceae bacterium]
MTRKAVAADGAYTPQTGAGVTSLCVAAVLQNQPAMVDAPSIKKSLSYLEQLVQPDGGIYVTDSLHRNYETSLAVQAFSLANRDGKYDPILKKAEAYLRGIQWDDSEEIDASDPAFGGAGYGRHKRPDLSNTTFFMDALKSLGAGEDDPAIQKALVFVSRCQNLESQYNNTPHADKVGDGGFYYTPAAGGQSQAGQTPEGGLRSYGSMTYAGLKSMIYAGLSKDDQRVKAAMDFIRKTYSLENNPGMGDAGLYYYYHTFAKALDAAEVKTLEDASGEKHDWAQELSKVLVSLQAEDGAWVNTKNDRWLEGDRNLVTAYALMALRYCK